MDVTAALAAFAAQLRYGDVPDDVRERCRMSLLDAVGIMLGAVGFARSSGDGTLENYLRATAPAGPATVLGYGLSTSASMAAFANGTLSEVLDFQDSNLWVRSHSGTSVIPVVLALAGSSSRAWEDVVPAIAAGYEVHTRLLLAVQPGHWYKGFQGTGTFGTCGAAAAAGRLLGFDARRMAAALGIAGFVMPVSNGDNQFKGYNVKPVHGGQAAMCGLSSAFMAQAGYLAGPLEGEPPRHHAALHILGEGVDLARAVERLGELWHAREIAYKPYPIGHLIVGVVELILEMRAEHRIAADEVEGIDVATFEDAVTFTGRKYTAVDSNHVDAHLSIPYCAAAALVDGEMTLRQLLPERLRDPAVHALAARVSVSADAAMTRAFPHEWPAQVVIRLRSGATLSRRVDQVKWSPRRPPALDEIAVKFRELATPVIGGERAARIIEIVGALREASTLDPLTSVLRGD